MIQGNTNLYERIKGRNQGYKDLEGNGGYNSCRLRKVDLRIYPCQRPFHPQMSGRNAVLRLS